MGGASRSRWRVDAAWVLAFGLASSAWCLTAAGRLGATFDEPFYLNAGLTSWRTGSNKLMMTAGTMPLTVDVQTWPIYLWERCRGEAFQPYRDIDTILPVARAANLVFWWVLLVYALLLGRTFGGQWAGRLAVALIACEPNLLGHAALATTDIGIVAGMLALVYHFYHGQGRGWWPRVFVPGLLFGVATLAKASGMVFGVQVMLALGVCRLYRTGELRPPPGSNLIGKLAHVWHAGFPLRKDLCWVMLVGFVLVFGYTGCDWGTEPTFVTWADGLPGGALKDAMVPVSHRLAIFPNAGEALMQQVKHNVRGHGTFLLGRWHERATPLYFPVALSIKTPLPVVALLIATLMIRPRAFLTPVAAVGVVLLAFSLNCRVQIGIRFMFPLIAVGLVSLAVTVARTWSDPGNGRYVPRWFVGVLVAIMAGTSAWMWPDGLRYTNQLWGGVERGYRHLGDSNYDWGQGLPALKTWNTDNNPDQPLAIWYFGTDPAILYPPYRPVRLHELKSGTAHELRAACGTRYLAVSTSLLYGFDSDNPGHLAVVQLLRSAAPVGRTPQFLVYDLAAL
ncbi:MAG: hypothetical protein K2P78_03325 [Gemmataceae bacterium]|nr:hypothetical protein [Gemmataceae bacterium]